MDGILDEYISAGFRYAYAYNYYLQAKRDLKIARDDGSEHDIEVAEEALDFYKDEADECRNEIIKLARDLFTPEDNEREYDE